MSALRTKTASEISRPRSRSGGRVRRSPGGAANSRHDDSDFLVVLLLFSRIAIWSSRVPADSSPITTRQKHGAMTKWERRGQSPGDDRLGGGDAPHHSIHPGVR